MPDSPPEDGTIDVVARYARELSVPHGEAERRTIGVELATSLIDGCDYAGVMILTKGGVESQATTSPIVLAGDELQYELGEGPCLDSLREHETVVSNDISRDRRWPRWGPAAAERYGIASMLSVLLFTEQTTYGALNLYSDRTDAYDREDVALAQALAAHLAVALASGRQIDQRSTAMLSRTVIGQAEGILMERFRLTAEQAFEVLSRLSQDTNRKLVELARELAETGHLTGIPDAAPQGRPGPARP